MEYFSTNDHQEQPMNSRTEVDQQESSYDMIRLGRFYECVFCKRGFDTAQALGGHMNIHRKDKARNKPRKQDQEDIHTGPRFYQHMPFSFNDHHNYSTYVTGTSTVPLYGHPPPQQQWHSMNNLDLDKRERTNQSTHPDDWRTRLDDGDLSPVIMGGSEMNHEVEIDLELRLGHAVS